MSTKSVLDNLLAMKAELEALGCKVTITGNPEIEEEDIAVNIVYPPDVPPPAAAVHLDDGDRSLEAFKAMIRRGNYLVLDTETTGLERGEIVQIAVIDAAGSVLLDTLIKPINPIPGDASRIHHIYDDDVADAPSWALISPQLEKLLTGRDVVIYNAVYDRKMMHQSAEAAGLPKTDWKSLARFWCAMETFAELYGDWNEYRQSYRWQKLTTAASYYRLPVVDAHSALGDCLMTLAVVKRMAGESTASAYVEEHPF